MKQLTRFAILFLCLLFTSCSVVEKQTTQEYKESSISAYAYIATDSNESKATSNTVLSIYFDTTTGKITIPPYFIENIFSVQNDTATAKEIILEGVTNIEVTHNNVAEAKEFNQIASYSKNDTLSTEKITTNESGVKNTVNYRLIIYVIIIIFVFVLYIACKKQK